ncbi:MAG: tRNA (adenosine(37)-N6)-threonylcarbamoyltransferase complex ATPase subunit type 1 TsaE [Bacilli bacterium]|nr:tRNA (adenosine(37)-N6)-threonylcarbamoyltransferase complex ATPase subunit type 1 TsaE [Bacilli bacterium]
MEIEFITNSSTETMSLGEKLSKILPSGSTLTLTGDLGAGKTTFVRGLALGLNITEVVQSPTFNIMKLYLKGTRPLIHIDAYRLADIDTDIGLDEYIGYETGITVIEWPMFIQKLLPLNAVEVEIKHLGEDQRKITFKSENLDLMKALQ